MYKLSFSKPTYRVNSDKRVVVCVYKCTIKQDCNSIGSFSVIGRATCSDKDTFNERYGKILADSRAKYAAYSRVVKLFRADYESAIEGLKFYMNNVDFFDKCAYLKSSEKAHINYLLDNEVCN